MRKLILISVVLVMIIVPFLASKMPSARGGLKRTVYWIAAYLVLWALLGPRVFFLFSGD